MTVVVDHDRGRVIWAAKGHGRRQLNDFPDLLTEEQREGIEVVTADGALDQGDGRGAAAGGRAGRRPGPARRVALLGVPLPHAAVRRALPEGQAQEGAILRSISLGVSNARVEAVNSKIKVAIRQGYGFRNVDNLIALVMLRCSDLRSTLPGREKKEKG